MRARDGGTAEPGRAGWARRALAVVRRLAGMPDYHAYLEHLHRCHPGRPAPSEREYFDQFLAARYGAGPTRCC